MPTPEEFAYAAGLLDGEGYFQPVGSGVIRCDMTTPAPVRWLQRTFGGSFNGPYQYRADRLPVWKWTLCRKDDREVLLRGLLPHLKVKRNKADAMLQLIEHTKHKPPTVGGRKPNDTPAWLQWRHRRSERLEALRAA